MPPTSSSEDEVAFCPSLCGGVRDCPKKNVADIQEHPFDIPKCNSRPR